MCSDRLRGAAAQRRSLLAGIAALACTRARPADDAARVAAARREGGLVLYASMPQDEMQALADGFGERFGLKVSVWRAGSERILQRVLAETRAGRQAADVVETNSPELEVLAAADAFSRLESPQLESVMDGALPSHRLWVGTRVNLIVQAVNTRLVTDHEMPRGWEDLADGRWRDRLAVEANADDWYGTLTDAMGGARGRALFAGIAQRNGMSARKGHSLLTQLVAAGEVPLALTVYAYRVHQLVRAGAPLRAVALAPPVGRVNGLGVLRGAHSPNAARLFVDYMLGDAQRELARNGHLPARRDAALAMPPDLRMVDPAASASTRERWASDFADMLARGRR